MGTAFLLPLLFKTNVPQHEHNTCAPPCTNKFYIQYSIFYHHCQLLSPKITANARHLLQATLPGFTNHR